jgi:2-dehydro-3-deoxygluconokinase
MKRVFCFGELLLRMSPVLEGNWLQQSAMPVYLGGAELNVASALAGWQLPVSYGTALPDNYLSKEIILELQRRKIDVSAIFSFGKRTGIYYLPQGRDLKNAAVIYDREDSSFASLKPGMIPWDKIFEEVSWFHFSAISPGLNENTASVCREALEAASSKRIFISVDLNHRSKLWQYGKPAPQIMPDLVKHCDLVMGNIWSANSLLDIPLDGSIHDKGKKTDYLDHATRTSTCILEKFPKCRTVANTFRFDLDQGGVLYYASLLMENRAYHSEDFIAESIKDKVGTGDCFMAGLIYGLNHQFSAQDLVNFATAAAFGKFQEQGDRTRQDIQTIKSRLMTHG